MIYKARPESPIRKTVTLVVTEDCNLRCRYCYEINKPKFKMSLDTAKQTVDFFLKDQSFDRIIWDFIGGEPFLEIDLIDQVTEYIVGQCSQTPWLKEYIICFSSNGTLLGEAKVREYLLKYRNIISLCLSLDGVKTIHDYNRNNSFDQVMSNFRWWRRIFPSGNIKATINSEAIPYIAESIRFFADELNLEYILMNTVFEDVWRENDDQLYEEQLLKAADFLRENNRYEKVYTSLFDSSLLQITDSNQNNWCGCGTCMAAVDHQGAIYPCLRFKTVNKRDPWVIGNIVTGIDVNKLTPFHYCHNIRESDCVACDTKTGCAWCTAFNYDETGSIFKRVDYMCKMHKARVRANKYFFSRIG